MKHNWCKLYNKLVHNICSYRKLITMEPAAVIPKRHEKRKKSRALDFSLYYQRRIALKFLYFGWEFNGLIFQDNLKNTVLDHLFKSLETCKLIESIEKSAYNVCGRTDKGVSAFSQVVALNVRSALTESATFLEGSGGNVHLRPKNTDKEIDYVDIINHTLPSGIRVYAWAPVESDFSARYHCKARTYKYVFPIGDLNVNLMRDAAQYLVGEHDFRNFAKFNNDNKVTVREITAVDIDLLSEAPNGYALWICTIRGSGFLYHMVRNIMTVLLLVGKGFEKAEVVQQLLNVLTEPCKPNFAMAVEYPLVLWETSFDPEPQWRITSGSAEILHRHLQSMWTEQTMRCTIISHMLGVVGQDGLSKSGITSTPLFNQPIVLCKELKQNVHRPLLERQRLDTLEVQRSKAESKKEEKRLRTLNQSNSLCEEMPLKRLCQEQAPSSTIQKDCLGDNVQHLTDVKQATNVND